MTPARPGAVPPSISVTLHDFVAAPDGEDRCAFVYLPLNRRCNVPVDGHKRRVEMICADYSCPRPVTDTLYSACYGCREFFCDSHLIYCTTHENQHCEVCCDNGTAPVRKP